MDMASAAIAVEANLFAFFQHLHAWPRLALHDGDECLSTISDLPYPLFNSVLRARLPRARADAAIRERIDACRRRGVATLWWTGPSSEPADLDQRLLDHGFFLEPAYGMAIDLTTPSEPRHQASAFTIEPVFDRQTLGEWTKVLCEGFAAPQAFGEAFADLAETIGLGPDSPFRHFLARVDGQAAATCSIFFGAGVAGIYDVATLPACRRRGVAGVVTHAALGEASAAGCRMAILHSSAMGASVYRRAGFRDVCRIGQYVWAPQVP